MLKIVMLFIFFVFAPGVVSAGYLNNYFSHDKNNDSAKINFIRTTFYKAVESENELDSLESFLNANYPSNGKSGNPLITAYYGGLEALKAKHAINPINKISHLIKSLNRLSDAVEQESGSLEIRFLRFSILTNLPGILGYGEERTSDRNKVVALLKEKNYSGLSPQIQEGIIEFMLSSGRLNDDQEKDLIALKKSDVFR